MYVYVFTKFTQHHYSAYLPVFFVLSVLSTVRTQEGWKRQVFFRFENPTTKSTGHLNTSREISKYPYYSLVSDQRCIPKFTRRGRRIPF